MVASHQKSLLVLLQRVQSSDWDPLPLVGLRQGDILLNPTVYFHLTLTNLPRQREAKLGGISYFETWVLSPHIRLSSIPQPNLLCLDLLYSEISSSFETGFPLSPQKFLLLSPLRSRLPHSSVFPACGLVTAGSLASSVDSARCVAALHFERNRFATVVLGVERRKAEVAPAAAATVVLRVGIRFLFSAAIANQSCNRVGDPRWRSLDIISRTSTSSPNSTIGSTSSRMRSKSPRELRHLQQVKLHSCCRQDNILVCRPQ